MATALVFAGCSNDNNDGSGGGTVAVAVAPTSLNVTAGGSGAAAATVTRGGGFTGAVTLTSTGEPQGMTVTFTPSELPASQTSSAIDITVAGTVAAGTYPMTISASGSGVTTATTTLSVVVGAAGAASVSLALAPATLTLVPGTNAGSTVTITRNGGFTGPVNLAVSGAPAGLTATVAPSAGVTGTTATVNVQAGAAAAGTYTLTVTASGSGIPNATASLPVTISSGSLTVAFCAADAPVWVAQQDGTGAWTRVNPTSGSTYGFSFPSGRGGVATVDTVGGAYDLNVIYATTAEFSNLGGVVNVGGCSAKSVNGTVAGVANTDVVQVSLGYSSALVTPALNSSFTLQGVAEGAQDLVAVRIDGATQRATSIILRRAINPAAGSTLPVLDFGAAEAFAPASAIVELDGVASGETSAIVSAFTGVRGSAAADLWFSSATMDNYDAVPAARLNPGELQSITGLSSTAAGDVSRSSGVFFRAPANFTITLGAVLNAPTVTKASTSPYVRPRLQVTSQLEYNRLLAVSWRQGSGNGTNVTASAGYYGALPTTWDVTVPDLSAVAGWSNAWGLQDGTPIDWDVTAFGGAVNYLDANIADGAQTRTASRSSTSPLSLRAAGVGQSSEAMSSAVRRSLAVPRP